MTPAVRPSNPDHCDTNLVTGHRALREHDAAILNFRDIDGIFFQNDAATLRTMPMSIAWQAGIKSIAERVRAWPVREYRLVDYMLQVVVRY